MLIAVQYEPWVENKTADTHDDVVLLLESFLSRLLLFASLALASISRHRGPNWASIWDQPGAGFRRLVYFDLFGFTMVSLVCSATILWVLLRQRPYSGSKHWFSELSILVLSIFDL